MTGTRPRQGGELIPFPQQADTQVPPTPEVLDSELLTEQHDTATVLGTLAGLCTRMVMLARRLAASPRTAQAWAVVGYRLRKAPRDAARLGWFFLRGHGRWITKGWTWATHGHLRADARAAWLAGDIEARRTAQ
jgi:S-DNA-T family DNA segregation ATPase FtsK/SpoIIIE